MAMAKWRQSMAANQSVAVVALASTINGGLNNEMAKIIGNSNVNGMA